MATTYNDTQIAIVDSSGNISVIYPRTKASLVSLSATSYSNVESCLAALGTAAFKNISDIIDTTYPVGSIYISVNSTNPGNIFGGSWVAWGSGRVPVGVNANDTDFNTVEKTGGQKTVTLTANQSGLPAHSHTFTTQDAQKPAVGWVGNGVLRSSDASYELPQTTAANTASSASEAHTNLQPYITCYMWKRTA